MTPLFFYHDREKKTMTKKKPSSKKKQKDEKKSPPDAFVKAPLQPSDKPQVEPPQDDKSAQLESFRVHNQEQVLTTNQGLKMAEDEFSLKAGQRGPTLLEDFHLREKIMHFDHERIPERIVHARGSGAYGTFVCTADVTDLTCADFLSEKGKETPVFVRFSTVAGSRGSTDTPRDVRGFAVKFYTQAGNYDLVGNNIPVFFIQDAIKFPDFIHAVKPEPHNEMPQAASAHDTFWDFITRNQETAHMTMWAMSDRAIPRSLRMMDGFGVHTYRFINKDGKGTFIKFHWRSTLGAHALEWDENTKLSGKDPDSQRRDLMDNIDAGNFPVYELHIQVLPEEDEFTFDFDILDATKLWPEELVPLRKIGEMTLNRNVDNFFAEVEQSMFNPGHVVPGIDFTNDPLLQGRLFSYTDTQLIRLGGPNFHQIPVNRPLVPVHNNQRDGYHMHMIHKGPVSYQKSAIADQSPHTVPFAEGGYEHYQEKVSGDKIKARSDSFRDHFSQAIMFYQSLSDAEKDHIRDAFSFELAKVERVEIRQNVVNMFANVDADLAQSIAEEVGCDKPDAKAGFDPSGIEPGEMKDFKSPALSMANTIFKPDTLKVAIFLPEKTSFDVATLVKALKEAKAIPELVAPALGEHAGEPIKHTYVSTYPVCFDALIVIEPEKLDNQFVKHANMYISEIFNHFKPLWIIGEGKKLIKAATKKEPGVQVGTDESVKTFIDNLTQHRFWERKIV